MGLGRRGQLSGIELSFKIKRPRCEARIKDQWLRVDDLFAFLEIAVPRRLWIGGLRRTGLMLVAERDVYLRRTQCVLDFS